VIHALTILGGLVAWLAMSVLVLSEGRLGLALGLAGASIGIGATLAESWIPALLIGSAGLAAAALRARDGLPGWGILPPGSTPRVILCAVAGAACAWIGAGLLTGPQGPARAALLAATVLATARLLTTRRRPAALVSGGALALAAGALGGLATKEVAPLLAAAAAVVALTLALLPAAEARARGA
jgi:hypothetical protein